MDENSKITICIPTRNRPGLLLEAVTSCFEQSYRPLEILVGDDSSDQRSQRALAELPSPEGVTLRFWKNQDAGSQARNVNRLFDKAAADRLVLLHDDDLLLPQALSAMDRAWRTTTDVMAVYGKQQMITAEGEVLSAETDELNERFLRTSAFAGIRLTPFEAGLQQQFPNDGYLIKTALARQVRCREEKEIGRSPDIDFGIRYALAAQNGKFVYLDAFTCKYRLSDSSVSRGNIPAQRHLLYDALLEISPPEGHEALFAQKMRELRYDAIKDFALSGQRKRALSLFFFSRLPVSRLSPRALFLLSGALFPTLYGVRERWKTRRA